MVKDSVMKLSDPESPPKNPPIFKSEPVKKRYSHAKAMALDATSLSKIERFKWPFLPTIYCLWSLFRIEKYSFVSLFTGKWGELSDDSEDEDRRTPQIGDNLEFIEHWCPHNYFRHWYSSPWDSWLSATYTYKKDTRTKKSQEKNQQGQRKEVSLQEIW